MRRFLLTSLAALALLAIPLLSHAALSVYSTYPQADAVDVAVDIEEIEVRINTNILDELSFTGTGHHGHASRVSVDNGATYTVSLLDDPEYDYIIITLTSPLKYSTKYTVTIDKKVQDETEPDPNTLETTYKFSFTTAAAGSDTTPPEIQSTFPLNNATNVPVSLTISVTFNELMDSATITSSNLKLMEDATGDTISTTVKLDDTKRVANITPSSTLSSDTRYRVTVYQAVTDVAGNHLADDYTFYFNTKALDATPPTVDAVTPVDDATGIDVDPATIDLNSKITVRFSEAMAASSITDATFKVGTVSGTVTYDPATWTATFTPTNALAYATNYTATVTTGVTDESGNHLASAYTWDFTTVSSVTPPPLTSYCQIPAFITNSIASVDDINDKDQKNKVLEELMKAAPNVLILFDNSGSMHEFAYKKAPSGSCEYGNNCYDDSYDPGFSYYGYFDNTKMYEYISSKGHFQIDTNAAVTIDRSNFWHGNFLNWLTMRRVDIIRRVLTGGKTVPRAPGDDNWLIATENPDRDHMKMYDNVKYLIEGEAGYEVIKNLKTDDTYNVRIYIGDDEPKDSLLKRYENKINVAVMVYNDGYRFEDEKQSVRDGGDVLTLMGNDSSSQSTQIENQDPHTWTPLAESLYEATRLFQAIDSAYNNKNWSAAAKDPIKSHCQKNFVLILTDGESTKDQNLPGTYFTADNGTVVTDPYGFDIKDWMDAIAENETATDDDSTWKESRWDKLPGLASDAGSWYLPGVAYYAHRTDMRSKDMGVDDQPGNQNLTIYTVYALDDSPIGKDLLKTTAKYGGFNDYDKTGKPDAQAKWDKDGNGIPDTYFEAKDGAELKAALTKVFNDILARVSSGTAASILSNSEGSGANILQAMFYPLKYFGNQTAADWLGELHSLWYYIDPYISNSSVREDSDYTDTTRKAPHYLNLAYDNLINFYFNPEISSAMVARYADVGGDGKPDIDSEPQDGIIDAYTLVDNGVDPDNIKSLWRAGKRLFYRVPATRKIFTNLNNSSTMTDFQSLTGNSTIIPYLMAANQTEAAKIINYISGTEQSGYRSRTVTIDGVNNVWKLGDIISSTPRLQSNIQLNTYNLPPSSGGYKDSSYGKFIEQSDYAARGMVYVGANDGMLHAFKLGSLDVTPKMSQKATLSGEELGEEKWAFIPRNALPYLRYLGDMNYTGFNHLYSVDGSVTINDVSIAKPSGCSIDYFDCAKDTANGSNWKTVLIGSMGLGGASKIKNSGCSGTTCVETPTFDPAAPTKGLGYSSYFALDITDQYYKTDGTLAADPKLLWEFSDPNLGFATSGVGIVRIAAKDADDKPDNTKNGHWYAVIASGPTGPISGWKFKGNSSQPLTIYILDLADGLPKHTFTALSDGTPITNAFASSISAAPIDVERSDTNSPGNYQDNALYIGYTQYDSTTGYWIKGGVLRLVTNEDPNPANWKLSKVIDNVGPVVTNISRLQDKRNHNLWLYFGTGRYFYPLDDMETQQSLYGIKEPCYTSANTIDPSCTDSITSGLVDQSNASNTVSLTDSGWYIDLATKDDINFFGAERSVTDPVALTNGAVFFTTFQPSSDVCGYGGNSYLWGVNYNDGLELSEAAKDAKALIQVSTGSFEQVCIKSALTARNARRTGDAMVGKPPLDPPPVVTKANLKPVKRILHIQEQ